MKTCMCVLLYKICMGSLLKGCLSRYVSVRTLLYVISMYKFFFFNFSGEIPVRMLV